MGRVPQDIFDFLCTRLDKDLPPLERLAAAETLGNLDPTDGQLQSLTRALATAGALEMPHLVAAYERTGKREVGEHLVATLDKAPGLASLSPELLRRACQNYPPEVREKVASLCKRLEVDADKQKARLVELASVLTGGEPQKGREIFFGKKASCTACHTVAGQGGRIGPDLSKIGGIRSSRDLLEAIVFPSASFVRGYEPFVVATQSGQFHTGIITRENSDAIYLVNAERDEIRIPRSQVESMERGKVSIMPQGLDGQLSRQELGDLIAFLMSLK
jgi:putative heme-binding domain-containing protein